MEIAILSSSGVEYLARWGHFLFGVTWIGLLYYFNFVQTEYFKEAEPAAKADALQKLAPRALWWFRWGAMFTFLTGLILLFYKGPSSNLYLYAGALMGILMFLNVWLIIWPNQQKVIGGAEDAASAGAKAGLASRTNTLFSGPMLFFMGASSHLPAGSMPDGAYSLAAGASMPALLVTVLVILAIEANAIWGKTGPITTVKGVIVSSLVLTLILYLILQFL
ncbi:urate hydroxylase PuuD [Marinobacterium arenosum]|uniref:urate hydroxylase PuuD n=1 Tax=Marinobacterium arenosum TaxID=2862496 RepID=UPI001C954AE3|nr:urate hydroxylase PuuD [Marinobacterium arenosum]MBY4675371.1 urate hydroxylase PuuD [Marinobacterium arenosum]